ncbi:MAG: hypothetical protein WAQ05_05800 [Rubrivivax sp.]
MSSIPPRSPGTPGTFALGDALERSGSLASLLQRARESRARYAAIQPLLPPGLRETVRPGPLDDEGWQLLVAHGAAAAKLRQLLPRLEEALRAGGWQGTPIKVRVQPRT